MKKPFPMTATRQALSELPGNDQAASIPQQRAPLTYVPPSHALALDPESLIVEGIRGAGKSFWWGALHSQEHRRFLASAFPEAKIGEHIISSQGFGGSPSDSNTYPSKDVIASLSSRFEARHVWRAVVAAQIEALPKTLRKTGKWSDKVGWVKEHPEEIDELLYKKDAELAEQRKIRLILFDALDRLADDWVAIRPLARALFQVALDFRGYRNIRLKIFVRPDMLEDREILLFPDSSKLLARKTTLDWRRADLYALVFQCLGNSTSGGKKFRTHCYSEFDLGWNHDKENDAWVLPGDLRTDEAAQKEVFHAITGPTMASGASGHKRGFPYTWLPNHLMDGRNQVSPRSFCAALRGAVRAADQVKGWPYPLDYRAIHAGVQEASRIRVTEITREDYPWIDAVMYPLQNKITIPCGENDIIDLWTSNKTIAGLKRQMQEHAVVKLPPQHLDDGPRGVLKDLEALGVIQFLSDGRIQMPDVYRIAFKLGRRGGVKPLR